MKIKKILTWIMFIVCVFSTMHLTSCSNMQPFNARAYSGHVQKIKPSHMGRFETTKSEIYAVKVYSDSVLFTSSNQIVNPSQIEVFDLDGDRIFDTVFVYTKGSWLFGTTNEFSNRYTTEKQTLESEAVLAWVNKALNIRRQYFQKPVISTSSPTSPSTTNSKKELIFKASELTW
jgi:hypothetical protein